MHTIKLSYLSLLSLIVLSGFIRCGNTDNQEEVQSSTAFNLQAESFADIQILRYKVPGWEDLSLQQKKLAYYLSEAALAGHDIIYDQNGKYNLQIRREIGRASCRKRE